MLGELFVWPIPVNGPRADVSPEKRPSMTAMVIGFVLSVQDPQPRSLKKKGVTRMARTLGISTSLMYP